jgi:hypothetical protein
VTGYGVKPVQVVEPLYAYYWLYAAVEPTTGEAFWWELPRLDAACFTVFLRQFSQQYAESLNVVLLDQAPAHVAQRVLIPENVVLVLLPAYSPELNPVERLWEGRCRADELGCREEHELRLVSVVCDRRLRPQKIFLLRLPLCQGRRAPTSLGVC